MSEQVLTILKQRRDELAAITSPRSNWSKITEWHTRTRPIIAREFKEQIKPFDTLGAPRWSHPRVTTMEGRSLDGKNHGQINEKIAEDAQRNLLGHLDALIELIGIEADTSKTAKKAVGGKDVFLVHGHNERWLSETARFIESFGLNVVILREQPNKGRTIIEKFEDHAADVGFAVVLLTGDDKGGTQDAKFEDYRLRARQNVILELGFFLGAIGRARVCALYEHGVEIPSDFSGVLFVPIEDSGAWRLPLAREMKAAALDVDLNKIV